MIQTINRIRLAIFLVVASIHGILIFFIAFNMQTEVKAAEPTANIMKLVDIQEEQPPPPPPPPPKPAPAVQQNTIEAVAETMIETDKIPPDTVVTQAPVVQSTPQPIRSEAIEYLPMHKISTLPQFPEQKIREALVYPPIALRSGIQGLVYLELFVDRQGTIQRISILKEEPAGRGFGEAAVNAFRGIRGTPAAANGTAVAVRYRYPVRFTIQ
ncbi:MAG: energy transducer TonB [Treponema sp.]|jgi:protein TonB|nr:energy transducer TonB [Treponema sp.]